MPAEQAPERIRAIRKSNGTFRNPWPAYEERGFLHVMKWKWSSSAPKFPKPHEVVELLAPKGLFTDGDHSFLRRHHGICPRKAAIDSAHERSLSASCVCTSNKVSPASDSDTQSGVSGTHLPASWASEWFRNPALHEDRNGQVSVAWIGHSTFLVQCGGINLLTDPVFSTHAAPVKLPGTPKRMVDVPVTIEDLPRIDVVTITHNHYDHLDTAAVLTLVKEHDPIFVVPLNMKKWFRATVSKLDESRVVELDWWQEATIQLDPTTGRAVVIEAPAEMPAEPVKNLPLQPTREIPSLVRVGAVPAQHWSMRTGLDRYHELWCGFVARFSLLSSEDDDDVITRSVFHAGDTGYTESYKDIGKVYQSIGSCTQPLVDANPSAAPFGVDIGLIPIGAYEPRWMMSPQHVDPIEALQMHDDIGAKFSIGMHWGTFILTDEPVDEPPKALASALEDAEKTASAGRGKRRPGEFIAWKHGEIRNFTSQMLDTLV
jgi:N-acyl-phosphatidylethanolamine-hydrolysing phospholipase D